MNKTKEQREKEKEIKTKKAKKCSYGRKSRRFYGRTT